MNHAVYAQNIIDLVDMKKAAELYGIEINASGFAVCPFHTEKTASFKIYSDSFYCFGCGAGGDIITFVRRLFDLDFINALKKINEDFSLNLPIGERMTLRQAREYKKRLTEIEQNRHKKQEHREERINAYMDLLQEWVKLDKNSKKYKPKPTDREIHPLYMEFLMNFEKISFLLDNFDWEGD